MTAAHLKQPPPDGEAVRPAFLPGCSGKVRHTRKQAAAAVLRRGSGQAYECAACGSWHTSGLSPAITQARAKARQRKEQAR